MVYHETITHALSAEVKPVTANDVYETTCGTFTGHRIATSNLGIRNHLLFIEESFVRMVASLTCNLLHYVDRRHPQVPLGRSHFDDILNIEGRLYVM